MRIKFYGKTCPKCGQQMSRGQNALGWFWECVVCMLIVWE